MCALNEVKGMNLIMKKIVSILLIVVLMISVTGCVISNDIKDSEKFKEEYESQNGKKSKSGKENRKVSISEDNPFVYTTAEDISKKMDNKETFIVYFVVWMKAAWSFFLMVSKRKPKRLHREK